MSGEGQGPAESLAPADDYLTTEALDMMLRWSAVLPVAEAQGHDQIAAAIRETVTGLEHLIVALDRL